MKYGVGIDISKVKSTIAILSVAGDIIEKPSEIKNVNLSEKNKMRVN